MCVCIYNSVVFIQVVKSFFQLAVIVYGAKSFSYSSIDYPAVYMKTMSVVRVHLLYIHVCASRCSLPRIKDLVFSGETDSCVHNRGY